MARLKPSLIGALLALAGCATACTKAPPPPLLHQIHIVGSSAAYPFSTAAAESFMRQQADAIAPLAQADGTGAGIARFCAGTGALHPDLVGAARAMTAAERASCARNGIANIAEVPFGWSALVLVTRPDTPAFVLSRADLWRALIGNTAIWSAINPALPALPIAIHGPTARADLADGLYDLILTPGCRAARGARCDTPTIRADGAYRPHGASADLVVKAVLETPGTIGIVPWATAMTQGASLRLLPLDGVMPSPATIASGRYSARMPLILYAKPDEAPHAPGLPALLALYAAGLSETGGFERLGLVPLDTASQAEAARRIVRLLPAPERP